MRLVISPIAAWNMYSFICRSCPNLHLRNHSFQSYFLLTITQANKLFLCHKTFPPKRLHRLSSPWNDINAHLAEIILLVLSKWNTKNCYHHYNFSVKWLGHAANASQCFTLLVHTIKTLCIYRNDALIETFCRLACYSILSLGFPDLRSNRPNLCY